MVLYVTESLWYNHHHLRHRRLDRMVLTELLHSRYCRVQPEMGKSNQKSHSAAISKFLKDMIHYDMLKNILKQQKACMMIIIYFEYRCNIQEPHFTRVFKFSFGIPQSEDQVLS